MSASRGIVLGCLRLEGAVTRGDVIKKTGLSYTTVDRALRFLRRNGYAVTFGRVYGGIRGRPQDLFMPTTWSFVMESPAK